ncbi:hypothetical protein [Brevibacillus reuszeri]|uniref:hypothetical protein n=1 Tax=Brevibacillus reuszeri TaxID=54915 RepID=UPI000CCBE854|nr:hypothetical protein [Brevibacillus reuszeri]
MDKKELDHIVKQLDGKIIKINPENSISISPFRIRHGQDYLNITMHDFLNEHGDLFSYEEFTQRYSVDREYWEMAIELIKQIKRTDLN